MAAAAVLDSSVLVLNRFYLAIRVVSVRRAMGYLSKQAAEVVFVENDRWATYDFDSWLELSKMRDPFPPDAETAWGGTGSLGIPAAALPHLFERFYRVDPARSRAQGGSGLGLAIVAWVVHAHGGTVDATSIEGEGSTFTVRLPAADAAEPAAAPTPGSTLDSELSTT